jgi:hypothetical protein
VRLEEAQADAKVFQTPEALAYVEDLQRALDESGLVGKTIALTDIVKTVHSELREGDPEYFSIPAHSAAVAQTLLSYQSSHRPDDLWHFVTPDFGAANVWLQLKSGDNQDMVRVTEAVDAYVAENPPPSEMTLEWAGLTYLNVVWQQDMVSGMLKALLGGFVIVFVMMVVLFRSLGFALLAMLPLTITIGFIYGMIGLVGKDYDMPVAVLSSLTLGLSIDFAIHFLQRARVIFAADGQLGAYRGADVRRARTRDQPQRDPHRDRLLAAARVAARSVQHRRPVPGRDHVRLRDRHAGAAAERDRPGEAVAVRGAGPEGRHCTGDHSMRSLLVTTSATLLGLVASAAAPAAAQDLTDVGQVVERANLAAYYAETMAARASA